MTEIIDSIRVIHTKYRLESGSVSEHTKSAQKITKEWQLAVQTNSIKAEVPVSPENNERIAIVDFSTMTAYELKVSGKNTTHEFFKDIMKTLTYNEYQSVDDRITKLVFISEQAGTNSLSKRIDSRLLKLIERKHQITIELAGIA